MSINLYSSFWKTFLKYLAVFALGCFVAFWFRGCSGSTPKPQIAKVIIPEVKGVFESKEPAHEPVVINTNNKANVQKGKTITVENPIDGKLIAENEKLKTAFAKETDSLKKVIAYNKAIQLNKFSTKFEDENLVLNINGVVQGEVKEITPGYKIKEKKIEVPVKPKETVFRLLGGMELGNNTKLDGFAAKANLMLQNKKGNILSGSFDTNQNIWIGYNFSIFDIKR
jgi:hypothetical protein